VKQLLCCSRTGSFNSFFFTISLPINTIFRDLWNNGGLFVLCSHACMHIWMYACMHEWSVLWDVVISYIPVYGCTYACMYACIKI